MTLTFIRSGIKYHFDFFAISLSISGTSSSSSHTQQVFTNRAIDTTSTFDNNVKYYHNATYPLLIPKNLVALTVIGFAKTGTTSLMVNLPQFRDIQYWGTSKKSAKENEFWFHNCFPKKDINNVETDINVDNVNIDININTDDSNINSNSQSKHQHQQQHQYQYQHEYRQYVRRLRSKHHNMSPQLISSMGGLGIMNITGINDVIEINNNNTLRHFKKQRREIKQKHKYNKQSNSIKKRGSNTNLTGDQMLFEPYYKYNPSRTTDHLPTLLTIDDIWNHDDWANWIDIFTGVKTHDYNTLNSNTFDPTLLGYVAKMTYSYKDSCYPQAYFNEWHSLMYFKV